MAGLYEIPVTLSNNDKIVYSIHCDTKKQDFWKIKRTLHKELAAKIEYCTFKLFFSSTEGWHVNFDEAKIIFLGNNPYASKIIESPENIKRGEYECNYNLAFTIRIIWHNLLLGDRLFMCYLIKFPLSSDGAHCIL